VEVWLPLPPPPADISQVLQQIFQSHVFHISSSSPTSILHRTHHISNQTTAEITTHPGSGLLFQLSTRDRFRVIRPISQDVFQLAAIVSPVSTVQAQSYRLSCSRPGCQRDRSAGGRIYNGLTYRPREGCITRSRVPVALPLVEGIRAQPKLDKALTTPDARLTTTLTI
jgi:hypothetical protein